MKRNSTLSHASERTLCTLRRWSCRLWASCGSTCCCRSEASTPTAFSQTTTWPSCRARKLRSILNGSPSASTTAQSRESAFTTHGIFQQATTRTQRARRGSVCSRSPPPSGSRTWAAAMSRCRGPMRSRPASAAATLRAPRREPRRRAPRGMAARRAPRQGILGIMRRRLTAWRARRCRRAAIRTARFLAPSRAWRKRACCLCSALG